MFFSQFKPVFRIDPEWQEVGQNYRLHNVELYHVRFDSSGITSVKNPPYKPTAQTRTSSSTSYPC